MFIAKYYIVGVLSENFTAKNKTRFRFFFFFKWKTFLYRIFLFTIFATCYTMFKVCSIIFGLKNLFTNRPYEFEPA